MPNILGILSVPRLAKSGKAMAVEKIEVPSFIGETGRLNSLELGSTFPFNVQRFFTIKPSKFDVTRGNHAHKTCHQFILSVAGSCTLMVSDSSGDSTFILEEGSFGVWVKPMHWVKLTNFSEDSHILVLASREYDPSDYIYSISEVQQ